MNEKKNHATYQHIQTNRNEYMKLIIDDYFYSLHVHFFFCRYCSIQIDR